MNSEHDRQWAEQLEAGIESDELLALAARLRQAGEATRATPSLAFQRRLRRDLLNQYGTSPVKGGRFWRWAGSVAALGLLAVAVMLTWLSISSAGRLSFGGQPATYRLIDHKVSVAPQPDGAGPASETVSLVVDTRWSLPPGAGPVAAFVHLLDANGQVIAQADVPLQPAADEWQATASLTLPDDMTAAATELVAGLYDPATGERLPLNGDDGPTTVALGNVPTVQPHALGPSPMPPPEESAYLEGYGLDAPAGLAPGGMLELIGRWHIPANVAAGTAVMTFLHLRDETGATVAQADGPLTSEATSAYIEPGDAVANEASDANETWHFQVPLVLPDNLPAGQYIVVTGLVDATGQRLPVYDLAVGNEIVIRSLTIGQAEQTEPKLTVLAVSPATGAMLTGTQPITFTVRLAYVAVTPPAMLEVKIAETVGENGRGVATTQVTLDSASGEVTIPVVLYPAQELNAPAKLGLWLQLRATADAPPRLTVWPESYRWRYNP